MHIQSVTGEAGCKGKLVVPNNFHQTQMAMSKIRLAVVIAKNIIFVASLVLHVYLT